MSNEGKVGANRGGNVYVFNVCSQSLTVALNGAPISFGEINGWPDSTTKEPYRPAGAAVQRVLNPSDAPGKFFNGKNSVNVNWLDGAFAASVPISGPLNQDFLLFIDCDSWRLVSQFGGDIANGPIVPLGTLRELLSSDT